MQGNDWSQTNLNKGGGMVAKKKVHCKYYWKNWFAVKAWGDLLNSRWQGVSQENLKETMRRSAPSASRSRVERGGELERDAAVQFYKKRSEKKIPCPS